MCRKCVYVKGLLKFQMGWPARKGLAEKVTCEQRPGRSEELALLGSGEECSGTGNSNCKGQKQDLWLAQHCPVRSKVGDRTLAHVSLLFVVYCYF